MAASRTQAGMSQRQLAAALDRRYDRTMIGHVENGRSALLLDGAVRAAQALNVSLHYLTGLTDDPRPAAELSSAAQDDPVPTSYIPLRDLDLAAGDGSTDQDETVNGYIAFREAWLKRRGIDPERSSVVKVKGDSMKPTLPDGCAILVDHNRRRRWSGRIYALRTPDRLVVKRLKKNPVGGWVFRSDNEGIPRCRGLTRPRSSVRFGGRRLRSEPVEGPMKTILAIVALAQGVAGRLVIAQQFLEVLSADDPTGTYVVEPDNPDSPIPDEGDDWGFRIVKVQGFQDTLNVAATREAKVGPEPQETTHES